MVRGPLFGLPSVTCRVTASAPNQLVRLRELLTGATCWGAAATPSGQLDLALLPQGETPAEAIAKRLQRCAVDLPELPTGCVRHDPSQSMLHVQDQLLLERKHLLVDGGPEPGVDRGRLLL
jgi:hypothetical protein